MTITKPCVVALTWTLRDAQGQVIDTLEEATEFLFGGDDLLPKIEEAIEGQSAGFSANLHLEPEHAFGEYDASLVFFEQRADLPGDIEVGMQFEGPPPGAKTTGLREDALYTVTEAYPEHVVLDGNHPLAGIALRIDLRVAAVRAATDEEVETGSVGEPLLALAPGTPPPGTQLH
jgi:FKBP-type peptidyl-prolyl cis-trans isomerase SlyD